MKKSLQRIFGETEVLALSFTKTLKKAQKSMLFIVLSMENGFSKQSLLLFVKLSAKLLEHVKLCLLCRPKKLVLL